MKRRAARAPPLKGQGASVRPGGNQAYHKAWFVVETASAPADSAVITCFFSESRPPEITGISIRRFTLVIISGIMPGMISTALGADSSTCFSREFRAMESTRKVRCIAMAPCFCASFTRFGFVLTIPSAAAFSNMNSTEMSLIVMPDTKSMCTTANFPWAFTFFTISEILQIEPYKINMTLHCVLKHSRRSSSLLTAAMPTLLLGSGTRWMDGTFYNIFIVWILSYCTGWLGMPLIQTYIITIIACIFKIPFTLFGGWCAQKLGNTKTFVIGAASSAILSIPTLKVIELSGGNLWVTIAGVVLGWSIAYNLIWACIGSLWSSYFETEVRYSGISFVYHVPSFLVAGLVPTICTLLINYGNGDTIYVGIYSTVVALISLTCAVALKKRSEK